MSAHPAAGADAGAARDLDPTTLLLIVAGAHVAAEIADRPLADRLRRRITSWQTLHASGLSDTTPLRPVVVTDLWYLNDPPLMLRPTIAVGRPERNAASAYFASRLPLALVIEQSLQIQLDPELARLHACLWGVDDPSTATAVDLFDRRYLEPFLLAAHGLPTSGRPGTPGSPGSPPGNPQNPGGPPTPLS